MGESVMAERYIAFDVETPNSYNNRMSAIGITVVENGNIVDELATLVDPETHFDAFNIQLTGISPAMAAEAPTFGELWPIIEPMMSGGVLVAHNAPFDMGVLAKCLRAYGICWKNRVDYICTCRMGRECYPFLPNHKLNTMCDYLNIELDHHQAGSDSGACARLLMDYLAHGADASKFLRSYDLLCGRTMQWRR
jgi:DNA polymerase III epsilon subunit family exonuclease